MRYCNALLLKVTLLLLERHWDSTRVCVAVQLDGTMSKEQMYNIVRKHSEPHPEQTALNKVCTRPSDAQCDLHSQCCSWSCDVCVSDLFRSAAGRSSFASPPAFYSSICIAVVFISGFISSVFIASPAVIRLCLYQHQDGECSEHGCSLQIKRSSCDTFVDCLLRWRKMKPLLHWRWVSSALHCIINANIDQMHSEGIKIVHAIHMHT